MQRFIQQIHRILKDRHGFTLMEVILGMSISTILLLGVAGVLPTIQQNYVSNIELSYSRIMASTIADAIKNQISFAYRVECSQDQIVYYSAYGESSDGKSTISFTDTNPRIPGLTYDTSSKYYMNKEVTVKVEKENKDPKQKYQDYKIIVSVTNKLGTDQTPYQLTRHARQFYSTAI